MIKKVWNKIVILLTGMALRREEPGTDRFRKLARRLGQRFPFSEYGWEHSPIANFNRKDLLMKDKKQQCPSCGAYLYGSESPERVDCARCGFRGNHPLNGEEVLSIFVTD